MSEEPKLNIVDGLHICDLCLDGAGGECHVPGCILWINRAPDLPIREQIVDFGGSIRDAGPPLPCSDCAAKDQRIAEMEKQISMLGTVQADLEYRLRQNIAAVRAQRRLRETLFKERDEARAEVERLTKERTARKSN